MASTIPDLWPDLEQSQVIPPVAILREQAAALGKKTNYLLEGRVQTANVGEGKFRHIFSIDAPALDNYTYDLFWIEHGADQYPVAAPSLLPKDVFGPVTKTIQSQDDLVDYIRRVLNSEKTKKVVSSLLAQVKATT